LGGSERRTSREAPIITGKSGGIGRHLSLILFLFLFIAIGPVVGQIALAGPAEIQEAKSEAQVLRERIDELSHLLDAAVEDYNYATAKLAQTKDAMERTKADLTTAEADLDVATGQLTMRLVEIYKQGQLGVLDTLVGSNTFSELINRLDMMERLGEQDAKIVEEVEAYQESVTTRKAELEQQIRDEKELTVAAEAAKAKVQQQLAANEEAFADKKAEIAQLEKEEAIRQAKLAAEAKRKAEEARKKAEEARKKAEAEAAAKAAAEAAAKAASSSSSSSSSSSGSSSSSSPAPPAVRDLRAARRSRCPRLPAAARSFP